MPLDRYATEVLQAVVRELQGNMSSWLLDTFFPSSPTFNTEQVSWDVDLGKERRLAPFVSPLVAGQVRRKDGYRTDTLTPAYIKEKRTVDPNRPFKRLPGEPTGGDLSPAEREDRILREELQDALDEWQNRLIHMAVDVLLDARITIAGEGYPTTEVDFGRDPELTISKASGSKWGETGVDPLQDIETWATLVQDKSGRHPTRVIMDPKAWRVFRAQDSVQKLLETRRGSTSRAETGPGAERGPQFKGQIGEFEIWVFQDWYTDDAGTNQYLLPDNTVMMPSTDIEGARLFGAIRDAELGYPETDVATKSWMTQDPGQRWVMIQSAPMLAVRRPNASLTATVA